MRSSVVALLAALTSFAGTSLGAQTTPPSTDIWLAPLTVRSDSIVIGEPRNVTHRDGYDNQPSFTPDSKSILYTANVGGQTDIFRYDLASGATTRVTNTPESEYSPTVMPGGARFSVVRVERDSTQRLWSFAMDGSDPRLVLPDIKPVGYHAWTADSVVALYVLGRPSALVLASTSSVARRDTIARAVGRAVVAVGPTVLSTQPMPDSTLLLVSHAVAWRSPPFNCASAARCDDGAIATLELRLPRGFEFIAPIVTPGPRRVDLLAARGDVIYRLDRPEAAADGGDAPGVARMVTIATVGASGLRNVTRLAVSPDGHWLAIVAEPAP